MLVFMTWPPLGECTWAASPASGTHPSDRSAFVRLVVHVTGDYGRIHGEHVLRRTAEPDLVQHDRPHHELAGKRHSLGLTDGAVGAIGAAHVLACTV